MLNLSSRVCGIRKAVTVFATILAQLCQASGNAVPIRWQSCAKGMAQVLFILIDY